MTTDTQFTHVITDAVAEAILDGIQAIQLRFAAVECLAIAPMDFFRPVFRPSPRPEFDREIPVTTDGTSSIWGITFQVRDDVPVGTVRLIASDLDHIDIALEPNPQEPAPTMSTTTDPFAAFRDSSRHRLPRIYVVAPSKEAVTSWYRSQNLSSTRIVGVPPGAFDNGAWPVADRDDVLVILPGVAAGHGFRNIDRFRRSCRRAGLDAQIVDLRSAAASPRAQVVEAEILTGLGDNVAAFPLTEVNQRKVAAGHLADQLEQIDARLKSLDAQRGEIDKKRDSVDADSERLREIRAALARGAAELRGEHPPTDPTDAAAPCAVRL